MMGDRSMSSGDDSDSPPPPPAREHKGPRKRRNMIVYEDEAEEEWNQVSSPSNRVDVEEEEAKPVGGVVRVSGEGEWRRKHFKGFEVDGVSYELEDTVLVCPEEVSTNMKPSVAIIRDITTMGDGRVMVTGQMFYRPELAKKESGGNWGPAEARELFYSFDTSEFLAVRVMHKCLVHFIPPIKIIPSATQHPGFIVQNFYDAKSKKLIEWSDNSYKDCQKYELNVLVQKTITLAKETL